MAFTFPGSPTLNQRYSPGGAAPDYVWNGFAWVPATPAWAAPPVPAGAAFKGCRLTRTGTQSIPNNTLTNLQWTNEVIDTDGYVDLVANAERINILADCTANFTASADFASNTGGTRRIVFLDSNGVRYGGDQRPANSNGPVAELTVTTGPLPMLAGSWMVVQVLQATGGALNANPQGQNAFTLEIL